MSLQGLTSTTYKPFALWGVIGSLYVTQGIPMGVAFGALPAILRYENYSTETIGLLGLVMIPWALKFLWAPFVDRHFGGTYQRRRQLIIPAQVLQAIILLTIGLSPHENTIGGPVIALLVFANLVSATQDIATDGLAIEIIPKGKMGWVNSAQIGGFTLGMLLGGSIAIALYDSGGWLLCFCILSLATLLTLLPIYLHKDTNPLSDTKSSVTTTEKASLRRLFKRKDAYYIMSVAATFYFARAMSGSMTSPFLVDLGLTLSTIALITGIGITCITLISSGVGGFLVNKKGATYVAICAGYLSVLSLFLWLIPAYFQITDVFTIVTIVLVNGIMSGIAYVAFFSLFMQWASIQQAGTDFSFLQSTETTTNIVAAMLGGITAGAIGFSGNFLVASVVGLIIMAWITFVLIKINVASQEKRSPYF